MSTERKQVLEMLAEGKISAEDADRLLEKLASSGRQAEGDTGNAAGEAKGSKPTPKFLRVEIDANDGDRDARDVVPARAPGVDRGRSPLSRRLPGRRRYDDVPVGAGS